MSRRILGFAAAAVLSASPVSAQTYVTIAIPGAAFTVATGINASGFVAGYYEGIHGFVRAPDGTIATFDPVGSRDTLPVGVDRNGTVVGNYVDFALDNHGFIRTSDGAITTFDPRHSIFTFVTQANGKTLGYLSKRDRTYGFLRLRRGRTQEFICHGAEELFPFGMNSLNVITGSFHHRTRHHHPNEHGFIRSPDGSCASLDAPGAVQTIPDGIDDDGTIAGYYTEVKQGPQHGFVRGADGTFSLFDVSGALQTAPAAINQAGTVIGTYMDAARATHAFLRGADGTLTPYDAPGATSTNALAINDNGVIVGSYDTTSGVTYAYIRSP